MGSPFVRKGIPGSEQMTHQVGHPTSVDWENFEGPELFKYRDNYYLMFSPNRMSARTGMYEIGVAQSDGPMNFSNQKKYPHPVLTRNMENHYFIYNQLLPSAEHGPWTAKYITDVPIGDWTALNYNDASWSTGEGGFGLKNMDLAPIRSNRTIWNSNQIYIRRRFILDKVPEKIALKYRVEANTDFYINGHLLTINESSTAYSLINVDSSWFHEGENIIAIKAENSCSGDDCYKFVDFGLFDTKGRDPEKIVIGQSQANCVIGPNGFERWIMYKAFFNGLSAQGVDRMHFYDKELVIESSSTLNSPGYHPLPALPTYINYFDYSFYYPFDFQNKSEWKIASGILAPRNDYVSELFLVTDSMTNYRFEVPFKILKGNQDYMGVYAYYLDENNWLKIKIDRDNAIWEYEINENGIISKNSQNLPEKFKFLEDESLVANYEEPWHTIVIYKNSSNFNVYLDYFNLTLSNSIKTSFSVPGKIGLIASSKNVSFDAIQYTLGWDEWDDNINGWHEISGNWMVDKSGLQQIQSTGKSLIVKGDRNFNYEFSVFLKNEHIPEKGKCGFYPLYIDENNYVEAGINFQTGKLEVVKNDNGSKINYVLSLNNYISRQYTFDSYPTTSYRYDFRSEAEISGVDILWFEGNYPYLNQTFDLPEDVKFYALQNENWQLLDSKLEGELKFSYFNKFSFEKVKTKSIKMIVTPKSGKACRAFSAYFNQDLSSSYYLRGRRENDKLYIYVDDSLKLTINGNWDKSKIGLFTENSFASFNGILSYQTGKVPVTKIIIPPLNCGINESIQLNAIVEPINATNKNLVWVSSDTLIATINKNNVLTRHSRGTVTITAWAADGGLVKGSVTLGESSGVKNINGSKVLIFPNPSDKELIIKSSIPIQRIDVFSLLGKKVLENSLAGDIEKLNIENLVKGIYLINLYTENEKIIQKFIKK
jgi:hypothetical protein